MISKSKYFVKVILMLSFFVTIEYAPSSEYLKIITFILCIIGAAI